MGQIFKDSGQNSMTDEPPCEEKPCRSDQRRQQVLEAAAECFRRDGFHGASISRISEESGMSPGHIYHFFENKEAIIAAIVEREMDAINELVGGYERASDVFTTLIDSVDQGVQRKTRPQDAALWMEVWAETGRNEKVAQIVRANDASLKKRFQELHNRARLERGLTTAFKNETTAEVMMALFSGLSIRTLLNPGMDRQEVAKLLKKMMRALLEA